METKLHWNLGLSSCSGYSSPQQSWLVLRESQTVSATSGPWTRKKVTLTDAILRALGVSTHFILSTTLWGRHCYTCLMNEKSELISQDHTHTHTQVLTGGQNSKRSNLQIPLAPLFLKTWCDGGNLETAVRTSLILWRINLLYLPTLRPPGTLNSFLPPHTRKVALQAIWLF